MRLQPINGRYINYGDIHRNCTIKNHLFPIGRLVKVATNGEYSTEGVVIADLENLLKFCVDTVTCKTLASEGYIKDVRFNKLRIELRFGSLTKMPRYCDLNDISILAGPTETIKYTALYEGNDMFYIATPGITECIAVTDTQILADYHTGAGDLAVPNGLEVHGTRVQFKKPKW